MNRIGAMGSIKMLLIDARYPEAVSLLRATRSSTVYGRSGLS